jgi:hypothetical protein
MLQEQEMHQREINYLTAEMESMVGMSGILPKYPERRPVIQTGGITLNNIHVTNSEIGVLNTGIIENVDATVSVLKREGGEELANAIAALTEAVIQSGEIANDQKNQIMELLSTLSEEAVAPADKRKSAVAKTLLSDLSNILGGVKALTDVWVTAKEIITTVFGI